MASCSKKVEVTGNFSGGSPLERIEFIEASGVGTLPLINMGVDAKGSFSGNFDAPKDGMYVMSYAGKTAMIYLKGGQKIHISGQASNFPNQFTVTGDAKNNNDFLREVEKFIQTYAAKINVGELITKKESDFLKSADKIRADIENSIETAAKKTSAHKEVVNWKKDELHASILQLMSQYEMNHPQATQNPSYKASPNFKEAMAKLDTDRERLLKSQPIYRNYLLGSLSPEFQKFVDTQKKDEKTLSSELFAKFLDTKKDISQLTKDYLLAFVLTSGDIGSGMSAEHAAKVEKIIKEKIKDSDVKKDLERILFVVGGPKVGSEIPAGKLITADGKSYNLADVKGKPTLVMFYASWNPYISEATIPVLNEVVNFYKSKLAFAYVNVDDTKDQAVKTQTAMLKELPGAKLYAEGGMNSEIAKNWGIYGFKLPSFVVLDKNGKIASPVFNSLGNPDLVKVLDKLTGLKAPVAPQIELQNDWIDPVPDSELP